MPQIGKNGFERVLDRHLQPFQMIQSLNPLVTSPEKIRSVVVVVCSDLMSLSTFCFSHIMTVSGCDGELNAHFNSAASLKYHALDT